MEKFLGGLINTILSYFLNKKDNSKNERTGICPNAEFAEENWKLRGACRCRVYGRLITDPGHVLRYCEKYHLRCKGNNGYVVPK